MRNAFVALACSMGCAPSSAAPMTDAGAPDAATTPFTEEAMRAANLAFRAKFCAAYSKCDPYTFQRLFGSVDFCLTQDIGYNAPVPDLADDYGYGSALTPDGLLACANALDFSTCEAFVRFQYEGVFPPECHDRFFGTLPTGSRCGRHKQCASGVCDFRGSICGKCIPKQPKGASCALYYYACELGTTCQGDPMTPTCLPWADVGEPCNANQQCHPWLVCNAMGRCQQPLPRNACNSTAGCAAAPDGQYCNANGFCDGLPFSHLGQPCNPSLCEHGTTCTDDHPVSLGAPQYVCRSRIEEGQACNQADHPLDNPCQVGICLYGVCQRVAATQCTPPPVPP